MEKKSPKHDLKLLTIGMFGFDCIRDKNALMQIYKTRGSTPSSLL